MGDPTASAHPAPSVAALLALDGDAWARVLATARRVLRSRDEADAQVRTLLAVPTARLVTGRAREELAAVVARDLGVWTAVADDLDGDDEGRSVLAHLATPDGVADEVGTGTAPDRSAASEVARLEDRLAAVSGERDVLRARVRELRRTNEKVQRRLAGATAREQAALRDLEQERAAHAVTRTTVAELRAELADAERRRRADVEREARRHETTTARLEELLGARRRDEAADAEREAAARRTRERAEEVQRRRRRAPRPEARVVGRGGWATARPGRPSRLPGGVAPDTVQAARALLHPRIVLLVDGYNVTRQHAGHLPLEQQRTWLRTAVTAVQTRVDVEAHLVWDGSGDRATSQRRGRLTEHWTSREWLADDDIVFLVEGLDDDQAAVVVTDDRELRDRVRARSVDLLATTAFVGALR